MESALLSQWHLSLLAGVGLPEALSSSHQAQDTGHRPEPLME